MTEQDTVRLLHEATRDLDPDVDALVRGGIGRGCARRRRRRAGTTSAAAALVGAVAVAVSVGPRVGGDATVAAPSPPPSDATVVTVAASEIPALVGRILGGTVGRTQPDPPLVDRPDRKEVHFVYDQTVTSVAIERTDASCPGACEERDGALVRTVAPTTSDNVTVQGAMAWRRGFVVTATSSNAAAGGRTIAEVPGIAVSDLSDLVSSDVWFGGPVPEPETAPPAGPARELVVGADEIPGLVTSIAPGVVTDSDAVPAFVDEPRFNVARFRFDGMLVEAGASLGRSGRAPLRECRADFEPFGTCVEQPDGSVVGTADLPGSDDQQASRAMTTYAPGYRIYLHAWNTAEGRNGPAVAPEPPLTIVEMVSLSDPDLWVTGS